MKTLNVNNQISEYVNLLTCYLYFDSDTYLSAEYDGSKYLLYKNYLNARDEYVAELIYERSKIAIFTDVLRNMVDEERSHALENLMNSRVKK
jgi:hypothetical protein